jgi:hypothetical protein
MVSDRVKQQTTKGVSVPTILHEVNIELSVAPYFWMGPYYFWSCSQIEQNGATLCSLPQVNYLKKKIGSDYYYRTKSTRRSKLKQRVSWPEIICRQICLWNIHLIVHIICSVKKTVSRGIATLIFYIDKRRGWMISFLYLPLYNMVEKKPCVPII